MSAQTAMQDQPKVIRDAKGKRPEFFETPGVDHAMSMIMVLANEMSVLRDRLDSAERVAKANGMDLAAGIESLHLDQEALEERELRRQDFLGRLFYMMRKEADEAAKGVSAANYNATIEDIARK